MQKKQQYSAQTDPYLEFRSSYEMTQLARHGVANPEFLAQKEAPVEYITGVVESNGMLFSVSSDVLIPRIETEELVEKVIQKHFEQYKTTQLQAEKNVKAKHTISIIDIGTGSGYLGISVARLLALRFPQAQIELTLCDISPKALVIAKANAQKILTDTIQVEFVLSDLLDSLQANEPKKFDIILANLPYIPSEQVKTLENSVKTFEPILALDGGRDGFRLIAKLLKQVVQHMHSESHTWLEVDPTHTVELCKTEQSKLAYTAYQDSFGRHRFIEATLV